MFRLVLKQGGDTSAPKGLLVKLGLFAKHPELLKGDKYVIKSKITRSVLDLFITRLHGFPSPEAVTPENAAQIRALCDELGFSGFDDDVRAALSGGSSRTWESVVGLRGRVDRHDLLLEKLQRQVQELERQLKTLGHGAQADQAGAKGMKSAPEPNKDICKAAADDVRQLKSEVAAKAAGLQALADDVRRLKASMGKAREKEFAYDAKRSLDGIIAGLARECSGNVHKKGVVNVTASSVMSGGYCLEFGEGVEPENAVDLGTDLVFRSANKPNAWICYDFKTRRVIPTSYTIRTYGGGAGWSHLKSWVFEVSNDGKAWSVVDRRENIAALNGCHVTCNFPINPAPQMSFRFLRVRQTGKNHRAEDYLCLTSLEVFGTLFAE